MILKKKEHLIMQEWGLPLCLSCFYLMTNYEFISYKYDNVNYSL